MKQDVPDDFDGDAVMRCAGKLGFLTASEARATATTAHWQYGGNSLTPYRCQDCRLWHLSGQPRD